MASIFSVDISEVALLEAIGEKAFNTLLRDHTRKAIAAEGLGRKIEDDECDNYHIIWATQDYTSLGKGYGEQDMITVDAVANDSHIIVPRSVKDRATQRFRTQDKAEVFTPSWICNAQNNLIDDAWFGRTDVFNTTDEANHTWRATEGKIVFPEGRSWKDYVSDIRMEITCGEAPYLVSRYDTTTGECIPIEQRIGIFDRKMRVVNENCDTEEEWLKATRKALQSCYGYEWQGDNLVLARENMLVSVFEYYQQKFHTDALLPKAKNGHSELCMFAYIISWNLWQMDGLKQTLVYYDDDKKIEEYLSLRKECRHTKGATQLSMFGADPNDPKEKLDRLTPQIPFCRVRKWPSLGTAGKGTVELFIDSIED